MENPSGYQQITNDRFKDSGWAEVCAASAAKDMIKASEAEQGKQVTTISTHGGVGLGRLVSGQVYTSMGNGFYCLAKRSMGGLQRYIQDGGAAYMERVKRVTGYANRQLNMIRRAS